MKTLFRLATICMLILLSIQVTKAQNSGSVTNDKKDTLKATVVDRAQNVFLELGGAGLLISANYDTRFSKSRDGIGGRIGFGFIPATDGSILIVPAQINYLLGGGKNYLETGLGVSYVSLINNSTTFFGGNLSTAIGTATLGYRYQPMDNGFNFRINADAIFDSYVFQPFFGLSVGYTLK